MTLASKANRHILGRRAASYDVARLGLQKKQ